MSLIVFTKSIWHHKTWSYELHLMTSLTSSPHLCLWPSCLLGTQVNTQTPRQHWVFCQGCFIASYRFFFYLLYFHYSKNIMICYLYFGTSLHLVRCRDRFDFPHNCAQPACVCRKYFNFCRSHIHSTVWNTINVHVLYCCSTKTKTANLTKSTIFDTHICILILLGFFSQHATTFKTFKP